MLSFLGASGSAANRVIHSRGVGARINDYAPLLKSDLHVANFRSSLALLHDIGYAHPDSGMHALDGARFIRDHHPAIGYLAPYIAWHSNAEYEYSARGFDLETVREEFPAPNREGDAIERALLWVADFTTSPTGERVSLSERVTGIQARYDYGSSVRQALQNSLRDLDQAVNLVESTFSAKVPR